MLLTQDDVDVNTKDIWTTYRQTPLLCAAGDGVKWTPLSFATETTYFSVDFLSTVSPWFPPFIWNSYYYHIAKRHYVSRKLYCTATKKVMANVGIEPKTFAYTSAVKGIILLELNILLWL